LPTVGFARVDLVVVELLDAAHAEEAADSGAVQRVVETFSNGAEDVTSEESSETAGCRVARSMSLLDREVAVLNATRVKTSGSERRSDRSGRRNRHGFADADEVVARIEEGLR